MIRIIIDEPISVRWNGRTKRHYEALGYVYTKQGDLFTVSTLELPDTSPIKVRVVCDSCGSVRLTERRRHESLCHSCSLKTEEHRERLSEARRQFYAANPERKSDIVAVVRRTDVRDKMRISARIRLARPGEMEKRRATFRPFWTKRSALSDETLKKLRSSQEYRLWRRAVYKRDGYQCKVCEERGGRLNAHHVFNFAEYPEMQFVVENGVTLCHSCHTEFHRIYGKRNNGFLQLEEFRERKRQEVNTNESIQLEASA